MWVLITALGHPRVVLFPLKNPIAVTSHLYHARETSVEALISKEDRPHTAQTASLLGPSGVLFLNLGRWWPLTGCSDFPSSDPGSPLPRPALPISRRPSGLALVQSWPPGSCSYQEHSGNCL